MASVLFRQPPRVVVGVNGRALERRDFESGRGVMHVLPADLIGEASLVVRRRIELVECAADVVGRVVVARREVVFAGQLHRASTRKRFAQLPVTGPCADVVGAERAALQRHLDAVVEPAGSLPAMRTPVVVSFSVPRPPASRAGSRRA